MRSSSGSSRQRTCFAVCAAVAVALITPAAARAQGAASASGRWTIEVYGGSASASEGSSGATATFAPFPTGATFTTVGGTPSRLHSSWFFGDGSKLLNEVATQTFLIEGITIRPIVPLDAALRSSLTQGKSGAAVGLRLSRSLSPKLAVEFSVDRSQVGQTFTDEAAAAFEATRASFKNTFQDLLESTPVTNLSVDSTVTIRAASSSQMRLAGAARWSLVSGSRTSAYVVAGGGILMNGKDDLQAILNGNYAFRVYGAFPMSETDRTVITISSPDNAPFGLVGGGMTYDLSARVGLRADVRVSLSPNSDEVSIIGSPTAGTLAPTFELASLTTPAIQFSSTSGIRSSLSATVPAQTTFTGSGMNRHVSFTVGIFRRF